MSGRIRSLLRPSVTIKNTLLPKAMLRAGNAGVIADTFDASPTTIRTAQEGFALGAWQEMTIWGVDAAGRWCDKVIFAVAPGSTSADELTAIIDDDSVDYITRTDAGMAEALRRCKARFDRQRLTAKIEFTWADAVARDPERRARLQAQLGTTTGASPPPADGLEFEQPTFSIRPGRDPDQSFSAFWGRAKRR